MSDLPKTIGLCPVCHDEFYMPESTGGDKCPNGPHGWDEADPNYHPDLVIYTQGEGEQ